MFAMFHPEGSKKDVDRWRQREECKLRLFDSEMFNKIVHHLVQQIA
jgi:hypothetical protein